MFRALNPFHCFRVFERGPLGGVPLWHGRVFHVRANVAGGLPAGLTWAGRASETTLVTGHDGLVETIPADCLAMPGYRLEHTLTTGVVTETVTVEVGSEYQIVIAGDAGAQVVCSGAITGTITADGAQRWTFAGDGIPKTATTTSLVLTVTGTLTELGVYPVTGRSNQSPPEYVSVGVGAGPEMVKNGTFDRNTDEWTIADPGYLTWESGAMRVWRNLGDSTTYARQNITLVEGKEYEFSFELIERFNGSCTARVRGRVGVILFEELNQNAPGVYSGKFTPNSSDAGEFGVIQIFPSNSIGANVVVDNISLKEVAHNSNIDGYKYFSTTNGNTVNPDGSINEATGPALPGPLRLRLEPALQNEVINSRVFSAGNWGVSTVIVGAGEEGIFGDSGGSLVTDDSATSSIVLVERLENNHVCATTGEHSAVFHILKTTDSTYFPRLLITSHDGTNSTVLGVVRVYIDTDNGVVYPGAGAEPSSYAIKLVGKFWRIAAAISNIGDDGANSLRLWLYPASTTDFINGDSSLTGSQVIDNIALYTGMGANRAIVESVIINGNTVDPRAADATLPWPLTTPQAEGMVIFEGEYAAAGTGGLIGFRTGGPEGPLYKATDTAQACSDSAGTINAVVAAHASDKSLVFAARWSTVESDKECLNQSSGAWASASGTKGVWTTDAAVVIGHSITAPLFINTASVYDEDNGRDFIEGNWS